MRSPAAVRLAACAGVVCALVAGTWFWAGIIAPGYWSSIGFGVGWFVLVSVVAGRLVKHRPQVRRWTRVTFIACSVTACAGFYWTSIRATTVHETVVKGVPASALPPGSAPGGVQALDPDDR